jgi:LuxR family maltose regulon positive regulatory protein
MPLGRTPRLLQIHNTFSGILEGCNEKELLMSIIAAKTIAAKISRPKTSGIYLRHRLFDLLDHCRSREIIWINGAAGSGKTSLISSYLEYRQLYTLWYQLDEGDADLPTFFYYLGQAGRKSPRRRRQPLPLLTPEYLPGIATFSQRYFEILCSKLPAPAVLVFDNYHELPVDAPFHAVIWNGLANIPPEINVIFISRESPPPFLAPYLAKNNLNIIGQEDLNLSQGEAEGVLQVHFNWEISPANVEEMNRLVQGWVAGLILLAHSSNSAGLTPDLIYQPSGYLFNYFASEIFAKTNKETQEFLLATAILPRMTPLICRKLTGLEQAGAILAELHRKNYFTAKYVSNHELAYQYHPLFREFLLSRAREVLPSLIFTYLKIKAAKILENSGSPEDGARLYGEVGQWDDLAQLILKNAPAFLEKGRNQVVAQWLQNLPAEVSDNNPWLLYWQGACQLAAAPREARGTLENAYRLFLTVNDPMGLYLAWGAIIDSFIYDGADLTPLDHWLAECRQIRLNHPVFPALEVEVRTLACRLYAAVVRKPEEQELKQWARKAKNLLGQCPNISLRTFLMVPLLLYDLWFSDLSELGLLLQEVKEQVSSPETNPFSSIFWINYMSLYLWMVGRPAEAQEMVKKGLQLAQKTGLNFWKVFFYTNAVHCALALGEQQSAAEYLEKIAAELPETRPMDIAHYYFIKGHVALLQGDLRQSLEYKEMALKLVQDCGSPLHIALAHISLAETKFEYGDREQAFAHLLEGKKLNDLMNSPLISYHFLIAQTHFALELGRMDEGRLYLNELMQMGKAKRYVNFHGLRPRVMARLCRQALEDGIEPEYVRELIKIRKMHPDPHDLPLENWPYPLKIHTLGAFRIFRDGQVHNFSGKVQQKPLLLLKALIALGGRDVPADHLADALWPAAEGDLARISLETTLHRLRRLLGREKVLELQDGRLSLDYRYCWVDTWAFQRMCDQAEACWKEAGAAPLDPLTPGSSKENELKSAVQFTEKCLALYQGSFLPTEIDKPWAFSLREKLRQNFSRLTVRCGQYWEATAQREQARQCFLKGLEIDESIEEFYQHLMLCYQRLGQEAAALAVYQRCRTMLAATLGVNPSSQTELIYQSLRR